MCKGFEEDRESDIAAADIQIFEFLQSGHRMIKEQEGLYVRYGDFQAFFTQASVDRARLAAENAAQAERIKALENEIARREVSLTMTRGKVQAIKNIAAATGCRYSAAYDAYHRYGGEAPAIAALKEAHND